MLRIDLLRIDLLRIDLLRIDRGGCGTILLPEARCNFAMCVCINIDIQPQVISTVPTL
jgi:hypothetical protein